jgi:hypothetical protein
MRAHITLKRTDACTEFFLSMTHLLSSSTEPSKLGGEAPRPLEKAEIEAIVKKSTARQQNALYRQDLTL